jgi:hypothetical protein
VSRPLKWVRLLEPEICEGCRFAASREQLQPDGTKTTEFECRRRDCDNWVTKENAPDPFAEP